MFSYKDCGAEMILTPINSLALLTGATDHETMTADDKHIDGSTSATYAASPRLALTGEVVLRLPSVFIRTVRAPVESRTPGRLYHALPNGQGDLSWGGNRHRLSPSRFVSKPDTRRRTARPACFRSSYTLYTPASAGSPYGT